MSAESQPTPEPPPDSLEARVLQVLRTIYDPEIPVDIHELGLIYGLEVTPDGEVDVRMTLTSPSCPAAQSLPDEVRTKLEAIRGVTKVKLELTWDPPWSMERLSQAARLQLGIE